MSFDYQLGKGCERVMASASNAISNTPATGQEKARLAIEALLGAAFTIHCMRDLRPFDGDKASEWVNGAIDDLRIWSELQT